MNVPRGTHVPEWRDPQSTEISRGLRRAKSTGVILATLLTLAACSGQTTPESAPAPGDTTSADDGETATPSDEPEVTFAGEAIEVVVPFSAGGPSDIFARALVEELRPYLPGEPNMTINNMPGAGGIVGANYAANSGVTDGTIATVNAGEPLTEFLDLEGAMEYSMSDVALVATFMEPEVVYVGSGTGIETWEEFAETGDEMTGGSFTPVDGKHLSQSLLGTVFETDVSVVAGYPGSADIRQAVRSGEIDMAVESLSGVFGALYDDVGTDFHLLFHWGTPSDDADAVNGFARDPRVEQFDLPTVWEAIEETYGEEYFDEPAVRALSLMNQAFAPLRNLHLPPGTDDAALQAWRDAVSEMAADAEAMARLEELAAGLPYDIRVGAEAEALVVGAIEAVRSDEEALEVMLDHLGEG